MTCAKRPKLDFRGSSLDIVSELIDRQLEDIAGDILANLSDMDIANAVLANPKWSAIATGRGRIRTLLSRSKGKTAPLKTIYRREELLAREVQDSIDARSVFLKACKKCSNLDKFRTVSKKEQGDFRIELRSLEGDFIGRSREIHVTDEFIVAETTGIRDVTHENQHKGKIYLVQVFDRWTFQLVNSLKLECSRSRLHFFNGGVNAILIERALSWREKERLFLWDLTSGELHALPNPSGSIFKTLCIGKLIVLLWTDADGVRTRADGEGCFATVYKVHSRADSIAFDCIAEYREDLGAFHSIWQLSCSEDLGSIAIGTFTRPAVDADPLYQLRSKEDFSLLQRVTGLERAPLGEWESILLSGGFVLFYNNEEHYYIDVLSFGKGESKTVFRFCVPEEVLRQHAYSSVHVLIVGKLLVLYLDNFFGELDAAIWKLPSDFIETCHRHLEDGTTGVTWQCDQIIMYKPYAEYDRPLHVKTRVDRFGILKCRIDRDMPNVLHVTMINSIISEDDCF